MSARATKKPPAAAKVAIVKEIRTVEVHALDLQRARDAVQEALEIAPQLRDLIDELNDDLRTQVEADGLIHDDAEAYAEGCRAYHKLVRALDVISHSLPSEEARP
jgi:hypothetical protein